MGEAGEIGIVDNSVRPDQELLVTPEQAELIGEALGEYDGFSKQVEEVGVANRKFTDFCSDSLVNLGAISFRAGNSREDMAVVGDHRNLASSLRPRLKEVNQTALGFSTDPDHRDQVKGALVDLATTEEESKIEARERAISLFSSLGSSFGKGIEQLDEGRFSVVSGVRTYRSNLGQPRSRESLKARYVQSLGEVEGQIMGADGSVKKAEKEAWRKGEGHFQRYVGIVDRLAGKEIDSSGNEFAGENEE